MRPQAQPAQPVRAGGAVVDFFRGDTALHEELERLHREQPLLSATLPDGSTKTVRADYDVVATGATVALGAKAPSIETPTIASVGGDIRAVFGRAVEDLTPDVFRPAGPPPVLAAPFVASTGRKQLEAVALEFRNCLAEHGARVAEGRMAVYVWRAEPLAAIALSRDVAGWRLAEAKAPDNVDLEEGFLRQLAARLDLAGVRTGPSVQNVSCRLDDWANGNSYPREHRASFIEDLALGDLWS